MDDFDFWVNPGIKALARKAYALFNQPHLDSSPELKEELKVVQQEVEAFRGNHSDLNAEDTHQASYLAGLISTTVRSWDIPKAHSRAPRPHAGSDI